MGAKDDLVSQNHMNGKTVLEDEGCKSRLRYSSIRCLNESNI